MKKRSKSNKKRSQRDANDIAKRSLDRTLLDRRHYLRDFPLRESEKPLDVRTDFRYTIPSRYDRDLVHTRIWPRRRSLKPGAISEAGRRYLRDDVGQNAKLVKNDVCQKRGERREVLFSLLRLGRGRGGGASRRRFTWRSDIRC